MLLDCLKRTFTLAVKLVPTGLAGVCVGLISACSGGAFATFSDELPAEAQAHGGTGGSASKLANTVVPSGGAGTSLVGPAQGGDAGSAGSEGGSPANDAAGSGGDADVAGGAGGGAAGGASGAPTISIDLIDDVEGQFPNIIQRGGRNGYWFIADDDSGGSVSPLQRFALEPPTAESHYAARLVGSGLTAWGALLGVTFRSPFAAYDASAYCAVRFLAKGQGDGWTFMISDRKSEPAGGSCVDTECYNHLGKRFQPHDDWQQYEARFTDLTPIMNADQPKRPLETTAIYTVQFAFGSAEGAPFELLVDDLAFVPVGGCK